MSIYLQTGDILLFHGTKGFFSRFIELFTKSRYSHCAIVIRDPDFTIPPMKGLYLMESTTGKVQTDCEDHRHKFGVQMHELNSYLKSYPGVAYVRRLHCNRNTQFYKRFAKFHMNVHNLPYDLHIRDWFCAAFNISDNDLPRTDSFWCSALVSYAYVSLGLLQTNWSLKTPENLSSTDKDPIQLIDGYLSPDINLTCERFC